ncbi:hypothetical protein M5K25_021002 [Dendrobium thyrsiflorum]|uniref:Uncharacterized protein n=1 Tax=Dendrobium thyrsiflorum TaxID=117978 RepID=A0ABD0UIC0_DENTH
MDIGADGSMPTEWSDMQVMEDSTTTTKKPLPSSGKGGGIKRKSKTSGIDQEIRECISLMADSVNEVANAIKSSTSPQRIRNMCTELMFELKSIPGFSEEEVDTIYDNLSKNPTLIPSFLSKPADSKARWIKKLQMHLRQEKSMRLMLERAIGRASSTLSPGHRHFTTQINI